MTSWGGYEQSAEELAEVFSKHTGEAKLMVAISRRYDHALSRDEDRLAIAELYRRTHSGGQRGTIAEAFEAELRWRDRFDVVRLAERIKDLESDVADLKRRLDAEAS